MTSLLWDRARLWLALLIKVHGEACFRIGDALAGTWLSPVGHWFDRKGERDFGGSYAIAMDVWSRHRQESSKDVWHDWPDAGDDGRGMLT